MVRQAFMAVFSLHFWQGRAVMALAALAIFLAMAAPARASDGEESALQKIKQGGTLAVAFYNDYAPFSSGGKGIDVDIATALAAKLGVKMRPVWFNAGEQLDDDLRKVVWKGTPLTAPADLLMHVPVDPQLMAMIEQVRIFAPYHREQFAVGRNVEMLPTLESLEPFEKQGFAVVGDTMNGDVMLSADSGRYRNNAKIFKDAEGAIEALKSGAVVAAFAEQGELEGALRRDARFAIASPPYQILKLPQWSIGLAVKSDSIDLATALQSAMEELIADGTVTRIMERYGVQDRRP